MNNRLRNLVVGTTASLGLLGAMLCVAADTPSGARPAPTSNKWRLELDGNAGSDGEIILAIIDGTVATKVTTKVFKGKSENDVAKLIRDQLEAQSPTGAFHVETDDGEDVLIKRKSGTGNFGFQLVSSSVTGLEIGIKRE
jgi:hypothetical protein